MHPDGETIPVRFEGGPLDDRILMLSKSSKYLDVPVVSPLGFNRLRYEIIVRNGEFVGVLVDVS